MSNITMQQVQSLFETMQKFHTGDTGYIAKLIDGKAWVELHADELEKFNNKLPSDVERMFLGALLLAASGFIHIKEIK